MAIKRKRSDSELSTTISLILSSPPSCDSLSPRHLQCMTEATPAQLSSRTRKRYRDNRPSESIVHQQTLSKLISAQRNPLTTPLPSQDAPLPARSMTQQQSSLHSFWILPSQPSSYASSNASKSPLSTATLFPATQCEDCNTSLVTTDGEAMDIDEMCGSSTDHACTMCGRHVCHECAVSNLGAQRHCLICAGKRRWAGGIGWIDQD